MLESIFAISLCFLIAWK